MNEGEYLVGFPSILTLALTEDLTNELFTRLTIDTDKLYNFSGA